MPSLKPRDKRALLVFFGGALVLFAFFAAGALIGKWARGAGESGQAASGSGARQAGEYYLVEVTVVDDRDRGDGIVNQLHRKYTSAFLAQDRANAGLYHVYIGPYPGLDQANGVADDLKQSGYPSVSVKPFNHDATPAGR